MASYFGSETVTTTYPGETTSTHIEYEEPDLRTIMATMAPFVSSETTTTIIPDTTTTTTTTAYPPAVSEVHTLEYPYVIDTTVSKPVQETIYSLGGIFTEVTRTLDDPVIWVTDTMARQRQRLALVDDQIRQAEVKIQVLRGHAEARHASRADKKLYKSALKDYKKICARRNKVWKTL
jgi:hypothetical protein